MKNRINRSHLKAIVMAVILAAAALAKAQSAAPSTGSRVKPWLKNALSELSNLPGAGTTNTNVVVASKRITLSYIDPARAVQMLALHGVTIGKPEAAVDPARLPVVVALPGTINLETVPKAEDKFPQTETDPVNELVVFHNENDPAQLSGVLSTLERHVDLPARQIIIEAMVLEISSTALEEMGVQWTRSGNGGGNTITDHTSGLTIGTLKYPASTSTEALNLTTKSIFHSINAQVKALVAEGEAEVLSRPSVLALDNRMAYINVSEDIPVANTSYAPGNNYQRTTFEVKKAGISLTLRPRVSSNGEEVSLQVNAEVTAKVPDADVKVMGGAGGVTVLASAPTISKREVKTYARVSNNTPFIIGGLIAKDKQAKVEKVPLLGDLPILGGMFRSKKQEMVKREVIIVLTPFVLPEEQVIGKNMPMDEDNFDSVGHQLFRDAYRIRAEDTFDLNYLYENKQLQRMKQLADRIVAGNRPLASEYPYRHFYGKAVPGESILCYRQIYEVLKRRDLQKNLDETKIIFFETDENIQSGHRVQFLDAFLRAKAPAVLTDQGGQQAVALSYTLQRFSDDPASIFNEPTPSVQLLNCADEKEWSRKLWELNQPTDQGQEQFTVLLRRKKDVERLKYAILMKKTVEMNTEKLVLSLSNFTRGRLLLMPRVTPKDIELVDGDVARAFFYSEMYYQALQVEMEKDITAFRKVIEEKDHLKQLVTPVPCS